MSISFEQAVERYVEAVEAATEGVGQVLLPRGSESSLDTSGRWSLRNVNGFLAYVTSTGKVLDSKFQPIGE